MLRSALVVGGLVLGSVLVLSGCDTTKESSNTQPASMGMLNDTCPISGRAVDPDAKTAEVAGGTIGFCCNGCVGGWEKKSESEKSAYVSGLK